MIMEYIYCVEIFEIEIKLYLDLVVITFNTNYEIYG